MLQPILKSSIVNPIFLNPCQIAQSLELTPTCNAPSADTFSACCVFGFRIVHASARHVWSFFPSLAADCFKVLWQPAARSLLPPSREGRSETFKLLVTPAGSWVK